MSGVRTLAEVAHGDHVCAVHDGDGTGLRVTAGFVRVGLASGDRVLCMVHGSGERLLTALRSEGAPVDQAMSEGRLLVQPGDIPDALSVPPERVVRELLRSIDDALAAGFDGLRLVGDFASAAADPARLAAYESLVSEVFRGRPALALCHLDRQRLDEPTLHALVAAHPHRLLVARGDEGAVVEPLGERLGLRLRGELDLSARDLVFEVAHGLPRNAPEIHLELAQLSFIDVGCLTELMALAGPTTRLVLHDPPSVMLRVVSLLWPEVAVEVRPS